ncbi:hypothetical protein AB0B57_34810 [Micromonospora sp. NPDC049101]|uniref:hypothetical protein n=1 Tax=unclassified Micromonospora TaxID=2617518 RepID=UPI0033DCE0E8
MIFEVLWRRALHQRVDPTAMASTPDGVLVHERSTRLLWVDRQRTATVLPAVIGERVHRRGRHIGTAARPA